jgi:diguanylate cyclase (GGDEF)-like protein
VPSEKYNELQKQLNLMVDDYELTYLYIMLPMDDGLGTVYNVCSATSEAERAMGETDYPIMYKLPDEYYTQQQLVPYLNAKSVRDAYSVINVSSDEYGTTRTVCKPLFASDGTFVGLLCADLNLGELKNSVNVYIRASIALIVLASLVFAFLCGHWIYKNITAPLRLLEERTREFAENSRGKRDLSALTFNTPDIQTENEIQSLSDAITQMSEDMKHYVEDILAAEKRAESAESEIVDISRIAYEDSLTRAKSKVAYDEKKIELDKMIEEKTAEFAVVMVNLLDSKRIDDIYGTEAGQKYIISGCDLIRSVFPYSLVYRTGDNDFVVILEGEAYAERDELFNDLKQAFHEAQENPQHEPWNRCAGVAGMTEFIKDADENSSQVFRRCEMILFRNKRIISQSAN